MLVIGSADEARRAAASGVDIIVAQGTEAGGHMRDEVGLFPLLPTVVDALAPTPVLAAGEIVNGRGLAAALALGAEGVLMLFVHTAELGRWVVIELVNLHSKTLRLVVISEWEEWMSAYVLARIQKPTARSDRPPAASRFNAGAA